MPRHARIVVPGLPHHITQRGNGRQDVFDVDSDRLLFLDLLAEYSHRYRLEIWGYCLMSNHFHLIAVPLEENSAARTLRRLEADYARYLNVRRRAPGHLWQARFYSAPMELPACWCALAYVERNPVRAGIVEQAEAYPWSSAAARLQCGWLPPWLRLAEWSRVWTPAEWLALLGNQSADQSIGRQLQEATLSGHPLGEDLARRLEAELGKPLRHGKSGRPSKHA
jgi:putative transposase